MSAAQAKPEPVRISREKRQVLRYLHGQPEAFLGLESDIDRVRQIVSRAMSKRPKLIRKGNSSAETTM